MIADDILAAIPELRAQAESLMLDTCRIVRVVGTALDEETGVETPVTEVVYEGRSKLQSQDQYEIGREAGAKIHVEQRSLIHVPVGAFRMRHGDVVTILTSPALYVAGQVYRLLGEAPYRTNETAYRMYATQDVS